MSPDAAIDYATFNRMGDRTAMTGEWLAHCSACPVPEIANVFNRARVSFHQVTGQLRHDPVVTSEVQDWIEGARVANVMFHNRLGVMGHYYGGMLDIYSDMTQQCAHFGGHIADARQRDAKAAPFAGRGLHGDNAAMRLDQRVDDG